MSRAPLSKGQKGDICREAAKAWRLLSETHRRQLIETIRAIPGNARLSKSACQAEWRRHQQQAAIGVRSLRYCHQDHYLPLLAWFVNMDPARAGHALKLLLYAEGDARRRALYILERETRARRLAWPEYPASICLRQTKGTLDEATEKQLWNLIYTVRNRRKAV